MPKSMFLIQYWNWKTNFPFCHFAHFTNFVQFCSEKAFFMQNFPNKAFWVKKEQYVLLKKIDHGINKKNIPMGAPLCASSVILSSENTGMNRVNY